MSEHRRRRRAGTDAARGRRGRARGAGSRACCSTDDLPHLPEDVGYRGPDRLRGRRHHLPPARLLGAHRPGRAERSGRRTARARQRLYSFRDILVLKVVKRLLDTGVSLQNIRTAVAAPARARRRRPGPDHADERRRQRLRVHLAPTRSSTWSRAARASSASPSAGSGARSRARWPSCPASAPTSDADADEDHPGDELARRRRARADRLTARRDRVDSAAADDPARESPAQPVEGAEGAILPGDLSGARTARVRRLWKGATLPRNLSGAQDRAGEATLDANLSGADDRGGGRAGRAASGAAPTPEAARDRHPDRADRSATSSDATPFADRHIGPAADDQAKMLAALGYGSLDALVAAAVPGVDPRAPSRCDLPAGAHRGRGARRAARRSPAATRCSPR